MRRPSRSGADGTQATTDTLRQGRRMVPAVVASVRALPAGRRRHGWMEGIRDTPQAPEGSGYRTAEPVGVDTHHRQCRVQCIPDVQTKWEVPVLICQRLARNNHTARACGQPPRAISQVVGPSACLLDEALACGLSLQEKLAGTDRGTYE